MLSFCSRFCSIRRILAAMGKAVLLQKLDPKGKKGAWLKLVDEEPARSREELLYDLACYVLEGHHEVSNRFYKYEEVWFVVESVLEDVSLDKDAKAVRVWDVEKQQHISFAFKYESSDLDCLD